MDEWMDGWMPVRGGWFFVSFFPGSCFVVSPSGRAKNEFPLLFVWLNFGGILILPVDDTQDC